MKQVSVYSFLFLVVVGVVTTVLSELVKQMLAKYKEGV